MVAGRRVRARRGTGRRTGAGTRSKTQRTRDGHITKKTRPKEKGSRNEDALQVKVQTQSRQDARNGSPNRGKSTSTKSRSTRASKNSKPDTSLHAASRRCGPQASGPSAGTAGSSRTFGRSPPRVPQNSGFFQDPAASPGWSTRGPPQVPADPWPRTSVRCGGVPSDRERRGTSLTRASNGLYFLQTRDTGDGQTHVAPCEGSGRLVCSIPPVNMSGESVRIAPIRWAGTERADAGGVEPRVGQTGMRNPL